ncbi:Ubiquitin carboxyl-terminal hydrolase [Mycena kentingensis (nom. inval.)]|nr:Ubiquitin carboxyl-terminal hydrolase [Mycena kentingensis (nom. inval.)]
MAHYPRPDAPFYPANGSPSHSQAHASPQPYNAYSPNPPPPRHATPNGYSPYPQQPQYAPVASPRMNGRVYNPQQSPRMTGAYPPPFRPAYPPAGSGVVPAMPQNFSPKFQHQPYPGPPPPPLPGQPPFLYAAPPTAPPNAWGFHPHQQPQLISPVPKDAASLGLGLQGVPALPAPVVFYPTPPPEANPPPPLPYSENPQTSDSQLDTAPVSSPKSTVEVPSSPPATSTQTILPSVSAAHALPAPSQTSPSTQHTPLLAGILLARRHHRPSDPTRAPGVMISPRARPPRDVRERVAFWEDEGEMEVEEAMTFSPPPDDEAGPVVSKVEDVVEEKEQAKLVVPTPKLLITTPPELSTTDDWDVAPPSASASAAPSPRSAAPSIPIQSPSIVAPALPETQPAPVAVSAPVPPAPKKSWASLFAGSPAAAASSSQPAASTLPTSSVLGVSIPAENVLAAPSSNPDLAGPPPTNNLAFVLPPAVRAALLSLLSGEVAPAPAASAPPTSPTSPTTARHRFPMPASTQPLPPSLRLVPRGLINTGNMCFANAVLQVLLCTRAFFSLFEKVREVLGPLAFDKEEAFPSMGEGSKVNGKANLEEGGVLGPAPLVRATGTFLREFVKARTTIAPAKQMQQAGKSGKGKGKAEGPLPEDDEDGEAFIPTMVYDAMKGKKRFDGMRGGHQEDAEEFLGFFLDTLEEELIAVAASLREGEAPAVNGDEKEKEGHGEREEEAEVEDDGWLEVGKKNRTVVTRTIESTDSPITRIFGGKFRSTLKAPGQKDSVIVEDWRSLRLDIQRDGIHTVEDALALISQPSTIQITPSSSSSGTPGAPPAPINANQQILIDALPPVLVLHLKRFCYDVEVGGVVKVGKQIAFGPELEISAEVMSAGLRKSVGAGRKVRYRLFGVIYHHGLSASGGHYTLDVLHPGRAMVPAAPPATTTTTPSYSAAAAAGASSAVASEGAWVRIDDELVSDVRPADVFGGFSAPGVGTGAALPAGAAWATVGAKNAGGAGRLQSVEREENSESARCAYLLFYRRVG